VNKKKRRCHIKKEEESKIIKTKVKKKEEL
jgi:hypothetical protein